MVFTGNNDLTISGCDYERQNLRIFVIWDDFSGSVDSDTVYSAFLVGFLRMAQTRFGYP